MSPRESVLGPMKDRVKTDVRLPPKLAKQVEEACGALCVQKNAFIVLAVGKLLVELSPLLMAGKKRTSTLKDIEDLLQRVLSAAA